MWNRLIAQSRWALPLALLAAYGAESYQSTLLAVLSPAVLLIYLRDGSWWRQFWVWLSLSLLWAVAFSHLAPFLPPAEWAVSVTIACLLAQLPFVIDRFLHKRLPSAVSSLLFPAALVSNDFLRHVVDPTGSYGMLGYSVGAGSPLAQLASVFGVDAISFMLAWAAALLAAIYAQPKQWASQKISLSAFTVSVAAVLLFAFWRGAATAGASPSVPLAMITNGHNKQRDLSWWLQRSEMAAENGARLIVWGEGALMIRQEDENSALTQIQTLAQRSGTHIVASVFHVDKVFDGKRHNKLIWIDDQGRVRNSYHKNHGQFAEGTIDGDGVMPVVDTPWGRIGMSICWDADFPRFMRQAAEKSVNALINPSYDFAGVANGRADIARFRAIENGVTLIRPNNFGWSLITDTQGQPLLQQWSRRGDKNVQLYTLALQSRTTLYRFVGDGFLWGCVVAFLALIIVALRRDHAPVKSSIEQIADATS